MTTTKMDLLFDLSIDMLCVANLETGYFLEINHAFEETLGYTKEELLSQPFENFIHPEDIGNTDQIIRELFNGKPALSFMNRYRTKAGEYKWIDWNATVPENGITYASARDVSEFKRMHDALQKSESRLAQAEHFAKLGNWTWDPQSNVIHLSAGAKEIFGIAHNEDNLTPDHMIELVAETDRQRILDSINVSVPAKGVSFDFQIHNPNIGTRNVHAKAELTKLTKGENQQWFGTVQDITQAKKLQAQLQQASKMEALGTLAGGVAHDFNNILNIISGNAERLIRKSSEPDRELKQLEVIVSAAERGANLVRQILTFSRPNSVTFSVVDLRTIFLDAIDFIQATCPPAIQIETKFPDNLPNIRGDAAQLGQILVNLCTNSIQAIQGRTGTIQIALEYNAAKEAENLVTGEFVILRVQDSGPGIDPLIIDRIFDPFYSTKPTGEGTGIGLSMVHGIVQNHNGVIEVESSPSNGTIFKVSLPAVAQSLTPEIDPTQINAEHTGKLLVVEDEPEILKIYQTHLESLGYDIDSFYDPQLAWEHFKKTPEAFDLVLCDHSMPKMNGIELSKLILKKRPNLPIIICSGFIANTQLQEIHQVGIRSSLEKPIKLNAMAAEINKVLRSSNTKVSGLPPRAAKP